MSISTLDVLEDDASYLKNMSHVKTRFHVLSSKLPWQPARQARWDYFHQQCRDEAAEIKSFCPSASHSRRKKKSQDSSQDSSQDWWFHLQDSFYTS